MDQAKRAIVLIVFCLFITSNAASQTQPPNAVCESTRNYDPATCLTITAFDDPLGDRIPVILIHGWNKDDIPGKPDISAWAGLMDHLYKYDWFRKKYKFYYLLYLSNVQSVRDIGFNFRSVIEKMDEADPLFRGKPLVIIGYSMGGLVARSYMQEYGSNLNLNGKRVLRLITLGTPHHGTPWANGPARDKKAGSSWSSYLLRLIDNGLFNSSLDWSTDNRYQLLWDNFDSFFFFDRDRYYDEDNRWLQWLNSKEENIFEDKLSVYGGVVNPSNQIDDCILGWESAACLAGIMQKALGIADSDGIVPLQSAFFEPCTKCASKHLYPDYNHNEIVRGRSWFWASDPLFKDIANELFGLIKSDSSGEK